MPTWHRSRIRVASLARSLAFNRLLSVTTLAGLGLNALLGWWWADPVAGLVIVVFLLREAAEALRGEEDDAD